MLEEQLEEKQALLDQLDELEEALSHYAERTHMLQVQVRDLTIDKATKCEHIERLELENKKLNGLLQQQQETIATNYHYASAVDALQQQFNEERTQSQANAKSFEETKCQLETALKVSRDDLREAQLRAQAQAVELQQRLETAQQEHATSLRLKEYHVDSLQKELHLAKKEHGEFQSKVNERLYSLEQQTEEKARELQQQRRDHTATIANYDQRLQKARMQYEEHLLQVTAKAGREDAPQEEYWRRKMTGQKREYESQIADLQKKLDEARHAGASTSVAGPRSGARQTRTATTLALTSINSST